MEAQTPVPPSGTPPAFEIRGVGRFVYDGIGVDYRHYVFRIDVGGKKPARVLVYLHQSEMELRAGYEERIRRTVEAVTPDCRALLHSAKQQLLEMMDRYEIDAPADYNDLVDELRLTHIKPFPEGGGELIFDLCSWIQNFNINIALDEELRLKEIWFDG